MASIIMTGSGSPLEKCLEIAHKIENIEIVCVYTNMETDHAVLKLCNELSIETNDISIMSNGESKFSIFADHDYLININGTVLFSEKTIRAAKIGALNMHPGRLPDYAGLHTHQWAIRNGENSFSSTLHWMDVSVDTGDIVFIDNFDLSETETGLSLFLKCLNSGVKLVARALELIGQNQSLPSSPQDLSKRVLYTETRARSSRINWTKNATYLVRFIRAVDYTPFESPTYKALVVLGGHEYLIVKAEISNYDSSHTIGEVIDVDSHGIHVSTGGNKALTINKMKIFSNSTQRFITYSGDLIKPGCIFKV